MPDPFPKGVPVRIKIRTETEFFQADATVVHATQGQSMGVMFREVRPLFLIILQWWLSEAQDVATRKETPATVKGSRDDA